MHLGGRGNLLLAIGFGGEDGNGEPPGKGDYRQERSKLRNPERCFQARQLPHLSCPLLPACLQSPKEPPPLVLERGSRLGASRLGLSFKIIKNAQKQRKNFKMDKDSLFKKYKWLSRRIFSTNRLCNVAADPPVCPVVLMEVDQSEGVGIHILRYGDSSSSGPDAA
ncbi:uncharacterized protein [Tursiops truncatus]|uniref:uncharacterized protein isoform X2 n=1 Tax=Tursiops truncatus TaxID=9739 RepID=UPI003CCF9B75